MKRIVTLIPAVLIFKFSTSQTIFDAVKLKDITQVKASIDGGSDVNMQLENGMARVC